MCFSAQASFAAAAVLGAVGAAALTQKPGRAHLAFTLIPLVFAAHQTVEGLIWLAQDAGRGPPQALIFAYLFIAQVFWPTYAPFCVLIMERGRWRRLALAALLAIGLFVSVALGSILTQHEYSVQVVNHSLRYDTGGWLGIHMIGLYMLAVVTPFLISRHRYVAAFGGAVLIGAGVTALAFHYASASVWCFFAALSSVLIFVHVRSRARHASRVDFRPAAE